MFTNKLSSSLQIILELCILNCVISQQLDFNYWQPNQDYYSGQLFGYNGNEYENYRPHHHRRAFRREQQFDLNNYPNNYPNYYQQQQSFYPLPNEQQQTDYSREYRRPINPFNQFNQKQQRGPSTIPFIPEVIDIIGNIPIIGGLVKSRNNVGDNSQQQSVNDHNSNVSPQQFPTLPPLAPFPTLAETKKVNDNNVEAKEPFPTLSPFPFLTNADNMNENNIQHKEPFPTLSPFPFLTDSKNSNDEHNQQSFPTLSPFPTLPPTFPTLAPNTNDNVNKEPFPTLAPVHHNSENVIQGFPKLNTNNNIDSTSNQEDNTYVYIDENGQFQIGTKEDKQISGNDKGNNDEIVFSERVETDDMNMGEISDSSVNDMPKFFNGLPVFS